MARRRDLKGDPVEKCLDGLELDLADRKSIGGDRRRLHGQRDHSRSVSTEIEVEAAEACSEARHANPRKKPCLRNFAARFFLRFLRTRFAHRESGCMRPGRYKPAVRIGSEGKNKSLENCILDGGRRGLPHEKRRRKCQSKTLQAGFVDRSVLRSCCDLIRRGQGDQAAGL